MTNSRSKAKKHEHTLQLISHTEDYGKVLVSCADISCHHVTVMKPKRGKAAEFAAEVSAMRHLCCA